MVMYLTGELNFILKKKMTADSTQKDGKTFES